MTNQITYETCFEPHIGKFKKIILEDEYANKLATAIWKQIKSDENRLGRKLNNQEIDRYKKIYMQVGGEVALEQLLQLDFVDYEHLSGNDEPFINKIIRNGKVNVITFSYGFFPLVYRKTYLKTIFICMKSKKEFYICGLGTPTIINGYNSQELVYSQRLKDLNRSAFYAFYNLSPLNDDLNYFFNLVK